MSDEVIKIKKIIEDNARIEQKRKDFVQGGVSGQSRISDYFKQKEVTKLSELLRQTLQAKEKLLE